MKSNIWHFWFSEKQRKAISCPLNSVIIKGKRVAYTECRSDGIKKPSGYWDDYKYLDSLTAYRFWKSLKSEMEE